MKARACYEMFAVIRLPDKAIINTFQHSNAARAVIKDFMEFAPEGTTYEMHTAYVMVPALERPELGPLSTLDPDRVVVMPSRKRYKITVLEPEPKPKYGVPGRPATLRKLILEMKKERPDIKQIEIAKALGCSANHVHLVLKKLSLNATAREK